MLVTLTLPLMHVKDEVKGVMCDGCHQSYKVERTLH